MRNHSVVRKPCDVVAFATVCFCIATAGCGGDDVIGGRSEEGTIIAKLLLDPESLPPGADCPGELFDIAKRSDLTGSVEVFVFNIFPLPVNARTAFNFTLSRTPRNTNNVRLERPFFVTWSGVPLHVPLWVSATFLPFSNPVPLASVLTSSVSDPGLIWSSGVCRDQTCEATEGDREGIPNVVLESEDPLEVTVRLNTIILKRNYPRDGNCAPLS